MKNLYGNPKSPSALFLHPEVEGDGEEERLAASIERAVQRQTSGRIRGLRVEVSRSGVILEGRCDTYYCKQLAQQAAMGLSDSQLSNQIRVS